MMDIHSVLLIAVIAAVTALLRFLPFLIFGSRETPTFVTYLGKVLPYAVMGMLVVYCLRNISFVALRSNSLCSSVTKESCFNPWRCKRTFSVLYLYSSSVS